MKCLFKKLIRLLILLALLHIDIARKVKTKSSRLSSNNFLSRLLTKTKVYPNLTLIEENFQHRLGLSTKYTAGGRTFYRITDNSLAPPNYVYRNQIGLVETDRFYFLFPWEPCTVNNQIDFSVLTGSLSLSHGTNECTIGTKHRFTPPDGRDWKIHWVCPFESIVEGCFSSAKLLEDRIFGTSQINRTVTPNTAIHTLYDDNQNDLITTTRCRGARHGGKYEQSRKKYVSGTNSHHTQIMDLKLTKFQTSSNFFHTEHKLKIFRMVRYSTSIVYIITRNRNRIVYTSTTLKNLLDDINELGLPSNVEISACRFRSPDVIWKEDWNKGPKAYRVLGEADGVQASWTNGEANGYPSNFNE